MDPLSMTASIITVLQLTSSLVCYIDEASNEMAEQKKAAIEASNLYTLLTTLHYRVEEARSEDVWFDQVKLLGITNGPLDQFKVVLETMVKHLSTSRKRDHVKSGGKFTDYAWTLSKAIHNDLGSVNEQNEQLQTRIEPLQVLADQDLQIILSHWLHTPDPFTNYLAALQKRHPETGQWRLHGRNFAVTISLREVVDYDINKTKPLH